MDRYPDNALTPALIALIVLLDWAASVLLRLLLAATSDSVTWPVVPSRRLTTLVILDGAVLEIDHTVLARTGMAPATAA